MALAGLLASVGCAEPAAPVAGAEPRSAEGVTIVALDPPAAAGAYAPDLAVAGDAVVATWLEPLDEERRRHRVRFARLEGEAWSEPATIAEGDDFFANWADFPAVVQAGDGSLYAHWLAKTAAATYAYAIQVARSADGGATWEPLGPLHDDGTDTEHGFVSWVAEGDGARAFWLDGREMAAGGPMTLRTAAVGPGGPSGATVLDERVCECCSTDAAVTADGPLVVYRDRGEREVRDIGRVRRTASAWSQPLVFSGDDWRIEGCPVNGPEVDFDGARGAAAWFSAGGGPEVRMAFSRDAGASFGEPIVLSEGRPLGRVDVALAPDGAWVLWMGLAEEGEHAEVKLRRVAADGTAAPALVVAETSAARASGFPRLVRQDGRLVAAWVELADGTPSRVRAAALALPEGS